MIRKVENFDNKVIKKFIKNIIRLNKYVDDKIFIDEVLLFYANLFIKQSDYFLSYVENNELKGILSASINTIEKNEINCDYEWYQNNQYNI